MTWQKGFRPKVQWRNVIITEKNTFSLTREIQKKTEEQLQVFSCLYFTCEYLLIYHLNKQNNLQCIIFTSALIFSNLVCFHF